MVQYCTKLQNSCWNFAQLVPRRLVAITLPISSLAETWRQLEVELRNLLFALFWYQSNCFRSFWDYSYGYCTRRFLFVFFLFVFLRFLAFTYIMFQSFISVGKIPDGWKTAIIIPLYKKGSFSQVSNYRPISLTSLFSRLMERIISAELLHYLRQNRLVTKDQHGFLTKKSTSTNLMESLNDWTLNIEKKSSICCIYWPCKGIWQRLSQ